MWIEAYLAVNLIFDFLLLGAVSRALGLFSWRRVLAADLLCAAYAALAASKPAPWASPPAQLALLIPLAMLLAGSGSLRLWPGVALALCAAALICGGSALLTPGSGPPAAATGITVGTLLPTLLFAARPPGISDWQVRLCLRSGGATARFPALIDTGNHLREPLSGLPVLIAEAPLLKGLTPEEGWRTLRFGAVGGGGEMRCFKPREVWIERGRRRTRGPEIWVAVAQQPLPGQCRALAPCEFTLYAK